MPQVLGNVANSEIITKFVYGHHVEHLSKKHHLQTSRNYTNHGYHDIGGNSPYLSDVISIDVNSCHHLSSL